MQLITSTTRLLNAFQTHLASCETVHLAVAWASVGFPAYDALVNAEHKIGKAVIGTHFYQTAPEFIEMFSNSNRVRFVMNHSGVFHPKLYLFKYQGGGWACIVGSANFTGGGFGKNQEASVLITNGDDPKRTFLDTALASINGYWNDAVPGKKIDINRYREMKKRFAPSLAHAAGQFGTGKVGQLIEEVEVLNMSWVEFLTKVEGDMHHALDRRIEVLEAARGLFRMHGTFAAMPKNDRQGIAGFGTEVDVPWGWFGSMRGAGVFKNLVNESPQGLSNALDQVPLDGQVLREDYLAFVERFVQAFPLADGIHTRHGLGTATRLLAMKRPDYFVCLDAANRRNLLKDFNVSVPLHDYEGYWDKIVERLKLANWWNARRPTEANAAKVWDGRVAMLDAIYYDFEA